MRILVVEDEYKIANAIKKGLENETFAVDISYDADDGLAMATTEEYDLVILDRMLPGSRDGLDIVRSMRDRRDHTPAIMLTAKDKITDRVAGLDSGADDYLVKPFAFEELMARIRALLRRPQDRLDNELRYENLSLNTNTFEVTKAGKPLKLSKKEYALLEYLIRNPDRIISKESIISHVWDYDADILPNTVEVYIGYLRNKIDKPFSSDKPLIHTVRGFGYKFGAA